MSPSDEPIPIPEHTLNNLFGAIGGTLFAWAHAEMGLVNCVAIIYQRIPGGKIEKEIPASLDRIIKYLRRCLTRLPELAPYKADLSCIIDEMEERAPLRNILVHGVSAGFLPKNGLIRYVRIYPDQKEKIHVQKKRDISVEELVDLLNASRDLATRSVNLTSRFTQALVAK